MLGSRGEATTGTLGLSGLDTNCMLLCEKSTIPQRRECPVLSHSALCCVHGLVEKNRQLPSVFNPDRQTVTHMQRDPKETVNTPMTGSSASKVLSKAQISGAYINMQDEEEDGYIYPALVERWVTPPHHRCSLRKRKDRFVRTRPGQRNCLCFFFKTKPKLQKLF